MLNKNEVLIRDSQKLLWKILTSSQNVKKTLTVQIIFFYQS